MAIETRKGRSYFYRTRRIGDRVVREYVAAGAAAELAAKRDREVREQSRQQQLQQMGTFDHVTQLLSSVIESNNILLAASLMAAGFHQHRGEWRQSHDR